MKIVVYHICSKCRPWNIAGRSEEAGECYGETHRPLATGHDRLVGLIPQTDFRFALRALHRGNAAGECLVRRGATLLRWFLGSGKR